MTSTASPPPALLRTSTTAGAGATRIVLDFDTLMTAGSGTIYVTDGAVQSVIDRVTGLPVPRIVGATDTHAISLADLVFDGMQVRMDVAGLLAGHGYSVVMGAGVLQSTQHAAFGGVRSTTQAAFDTPAPGDHTGPALLSFTTDQGTLVAGGGITVTLTFSEAIQGLDAAALSAPNAVIGAIQGSSDGLVWTVRLGAPDGPIEAAYNRLDLDLGQVRDLAGNAGDGHPTAGVYTVDTVVGGWVTDIGIDDTGASTSDGVTKAAYIYFSGEFAGDVAYGQRVDIDVVKVGSVEARHYYAFPDNGDGTWSYSQDAYLEDGVYMVSVHLDDGAGRHASATVTRQITIDTKAPTLVSKPDANLAFDIAGPLQLVFDEAVYARNGQILRLVDQTTGTGTDIKLRDANFSADHKTLVVTANQLQWQAGHDYTVGLPFKLSDLAGNFADSETAIGLHADGSWQDGTRPTAYAATASHYGVFGVGQSIEIRIGFDEAVQASAAGSVPALQLNSGGVATYSGFDARSRELVYNYTIKAGENAGHLDLADRYALAGHIQDLAGNVLDAAHISYSHLVAADAYGNPMDLVIDTMAPEAPTALHLDAASDSGEVGDGITDYGSQIIAGSGEANARIELFDGDAKIGETRVDSHGNWRIETGLGAGLHSLSATQTDDAYNTSGFSSPFQLSVEETLPPPPPPVPGMPSLAPGSDSGSASDDNITNAALPTLTGFAEGAGATLHIYEGITYLGQVDAADDGSWSYTLSAGQALSENRAYAFTARQVDGDRAGDPSSPLVVFFDDLAPELTDPSLGVSGGVDGTWLDLDFDEAVVFAQGSIRLFNGNPAASGELVAQYDSDQSENWRIVEGSDGHATLELKVQYAALRSEVWIEFGDGSIQDLAGNVAIVGENPYYPSLA